MAKRVEFKTKDGKFLNLDKPLASRLEAREQGKIVKEVGAETEAKDFAKLEKALQKSEAEVEKLNKQLDKLSNKQEKQVLNNK